MNSRLRDSISRRGIKEQLDPIFKPKAIAVVGASNTFRKWGYVMMERLIRSGYKGSMYPVNLHEKEVLGVHCYSKVEEIHGDIDLVVMTTPSKTIPRLICECKAKGVKGIIVVSSGFAEIGDEGLELEQEMKVHAHKAGIRIVGPNCMGIWSAAGGFNLCFPEAPKRGSIAFVSQSGTFGGAMAQVASSRGSGLSKFVSMGNQADLSAADYLEYLAEDEDTKVIVLYLEGVRDGRRFFMAAKEVIARKPIIVYKAGQSLVGAQSAMSHTAAISGAKDVFESVCRQVGIIQARESFHLLDIAEALVGAPLPSGRRVAILGSGGQGVVGADSCSALGLELPALDKEASSEINALLPAHAPRARNPIDFAGSTRTALEEAEIIEKLLKLDYIDGVISNVPVSPQLWDPSLRVDEDKEFISEDTRIALEGARSYASLPRKYAKPVICQRFLRIENDVIENILRKGGIPIYDTPEQAARAMYALTYYAQARRRFDDRAWNFQSFISLHN
jgi:acyl-CoA synthetase (NDP forming)